MHATVVTFDVSPEKLETASAGIKENSSRLPNTPGFQQGYWIYDSEHETMFAVVLFDTEEHAKATWAEAKPRVTERIKSVGATPNAHSGEVIHQVQP